MIAFKPLQVPRCLLQVIDLMLTTIPEKQWSLREALGRSKKDNLYQAPETQDFMGVAKTLHNYCNSIENEEWVIKTLKIWRNEEFQLISENSA